MHDTRIQRAAGKLIVYLLLIAICFLAFLPFLWMVRSSFMELKQMYKVPTEWIPRPWTLDNFKQAITQTNMFRYLGNTVFVVVMNIIGTTLTASMAAYAFSRLKWKGRDVIFVLLLSSMMLPGAVTMIPVYVGWSRLHCIDTYWPLILPAYFGGGAYNIFLLRQFMKGIPKELDEAATIDGAGKFRIFWNLILPLTKASLVVVAMFCFMGVWNDFLNPLLYLNTEAKYTVSVSLQSLRGNYSSKWNLIMAASAIVVLPCVVVFLFGQKHIIGGIAISGIKG